jgi:hypothetical protein
MAADGFRSNKDLWLWVPAFAGTTNSMVRSQIQISNSPLLQPRLRDLAAQAREFSCTFCPRRIRGRRECRAPDAPAAARGV